MDIGHGLLTPTNS